MARNQRQFRPSELDVHWNSGPRTPAWDDLWSHLFQHVLGAESAQDNLVVTEAEGEKEQVKQSERQPSV